MRLYLIFVAIMLPGLGLWFWYGSRPSASQPTVFENTRVIPDPVPISDIPIASEPKPMELRSIHYSVPFTSQAPTGDWSKSVFQDGCEEASTLIVWMAREGKRLTPNEVKSKLVDMATFETKRIGHGVDTNVADTTEILLGEYFAIADMRVEYDFDLEKLKLSVQDGLIIVPTNGRALKNPNFTAPGPLEHMLVITGYDLEKKEFITNDPGTRKGEGYRYPERVLYDAIREYPTGKHLPITTERKAMIVVPLASQG